MRIALWHNLPSGGGKRGLHDQVRGLVARGHQLEAWCPDVSDSRFLPLSEQIAEHRLPLRLSRRPKAPGLARYRWTLRSLRAFDAHTRACAEQIERAGFDVVLAHPCAVFRTSPLARHLRTPNALYLHEPMRSLFETRERSAWEALPSFGRSAWRFGAWQQRTRDALRVRAQRIQLREEIANARAFDALLVNSLYSRESVLRAYGIEASSSPLGVDTSRFRRRDVAREDYVISVGAMVRHKRADFVVDAVAEAAEPKPRLVWIANVADERYAAEVRARAVARGVEFELRVGVSEDELIRALSAASAFLYAPRLEPFGLAALEANACGLPVVAVAEGGVRETVVDGINGVVVEPEPRAMARALDELRRNPERARELGAQGQRWVRERWSPEYAAAQLEERLLQVIASHRR